MSETTMRELVARLATEPDLGKALDADRASFAARHGLTAADVDMLAALRVTAAEGTGPVRLAERLSRMGGGGAASTLSALAEGVADAAAPTARVDPPVAQPVAAQPIAAQPITAQPISPEPVPIVPPAVAQPVPDQPVAAQPTSTPPVALVPPPVVPTAVPTTQLSLGNDVITQPGPVVQPDLGPLAEPLARLGGAYDDPPRSAYVGPPSTRTGPATAVPTAGEQARSLLPDAGVGQIVAPAAAASPPLPDFPVEQPLPAGEPDRVETDADGQQVRVYGDITVTDLGGDITLTVDRSGTRTTRYPDGHVVEEFGGGRSRTRTAEGMTTTVAPGRYVEQSAGWQRTLTVEIDGTARFIDISGGVVIRDETLRSDGRGGWTRLDGSSLYPTGTPELPERPTGVPQPIASSDPRTRTLIYPDQTTVAVTPRGETITTFADGTGVTERPDGSTELRRPDGSSWLLYPDGSTSATGADGVQHNRWSNGDTSLLYPDGGYTESIGGAVTTTTPQPDGTMSRIVRGPEGTIVESFYRVTDQGGADVAPDERLAGLAELPGGPDGEPQTVTADPRARSVTRSYGDGTVITTHGDGRVTTTYDGGATVERATDGTVTHQRPDGTRIVVTPDRIKDTVWPDGGTRREYPDGHQQWVIPNIDGTVHVVDGTPGVDLTAYTAVRRPDGGLQQVDGDRPGWQGELPPVPTGYVWESKVLPDGSMERRFTDGLVVTSDREGRVTVAPDIGGAAVGTAVRQVDGTIHVQKADRSTLTIFPDGSAEHITPLGDSRAHVVRRGPDGQTTAEFDTEPGQSEPQPRTATSIVAERLATGSARGPAPLVAGQIVIDPDGSHIVRFTDGGTATVTANADGSVHVVEVDPSGNRIEYDVAPEAAPTPIAAPSGTPTTATAAAAAVAGGVAGTAAGAALRRPRSPQPRS